MISSGLCHKKMLLESVNIPLGVPLSNKTAKNALAKNNNSITGTITWIVQGLGEIGHSWGNKTPGTDAILSTFLMTSMWQFHTKAP